MNSKSRMPTTSVLLLFSWLIAITGFIASVCLIVLGPRPVGAIIRDLFILLGSLFLAAVVRMLAIIGQLIFDLKKEAVETKYITKQILETRHIFTEVKDLLARGLLILEEINYNSKEIPQGLKDLEQINCDSRDINQSIGQIKTFFEQIERHLDLKK